MGGGIGMGNTCKSMADSFQCMTKPTTIKKKKRRRRRLSPKRDPLNWPGQWTAHTEGTQPDYTLGAVGARPRSPGPAQLLKVLPPTLSTDSPGVICL